MKTGKNTMHGSAEPKYIVSQLYSVYKANELKKEHENLTGSKYDVVIRWRCDYSPTKTLKMGEFQATSDKNIFIPTLPFSNHGHPSCGICTHIEHDSDHAADVCDIFAFSSSGTMDYYSSLYLNYKGLYDNLQEENKVNLPKVRHFDHKEFKATDIWQNHQIHCFYPERLLRYHLKGYRLLGSVTAGKIVR
jgi:hypothetical protein